MGKKKPKDCLKQTLNRFSIHIFNSFCDWGWRRKQAHFVTEADCLQWLFTLTRCPELKGLLVTSNQNPELVNKESPVAPVGTAAQRLRSGLSANCSGEQKQCTAREAALPSWARSMSTMAISKCKLLTQPDNPRCLKFSSNQVDIHCDKWILTIH